MPMKRRRPPVATDKRFHKPSSATDHGTTERWQHAGRLLELIEQEGVIAARVTEEHILDTLAARGLLSKNQSMAAFELKLDFQRAGLTAHVISGYSPIHTGKDYFYGRHDRNDVEESAYQRWRLAIQEVGAPYRSTVITTVCHDELPRPDDIDNLQRGLDKLVDWYHVPKEDQV